MLLDRFVELCREKGPDLAKRLDPEAQSEAEDQWAAAARDRWYALPAVAQDRSLLYAVDGSGHVAALNSGFYVVVAQSFLAGPTDADTVAEVDLEIADARRSATDVASLRDLMMRRLESQVALAAARRIERPQESVLLLDGSLYAELTHLSLSYGWGVTFGLGLNGGRSPATQPGRVEQTLEDYVYLSRWSAEQDLLVMGVAKTTRAQFMARLLEQDGLPTEEGRPSDPELLYRWLTGTGYSHPILLGATEPGDLPLQPEAEELLAQCPAMVSCYIRPAPNDDPLRIDVPASAVGQAESFQAVEQAWVPDRRAIEPIVALVLALYGGHTVHNAPLYKVDRKVRLSRRTVEQVYLPVLERVANVPLSVDRSRRRFPVS